MPFNSILSYVTVCICALSGRNTVLSTDFEYYGADFVWIIARPPFLYSYFFSVSNLEPNTPSEHVLVINPGL